MAEEKKTEEVISEEQGFVDASVKQYQRCMEHDRTERQLANRDLEFEEGSDDAQWDGPVLQIRKTQIPPRPCITINKISEKVDLVEGNYRQATPKAHVIPVDSVADPEIAKIIQGLIDQIFANGQTKAAHNTAYGQNIRCGRGHWQFNIEDAGLDTFDRDIVIKRSVNVFSLVYDYLATALDRSDARYAFKYEKIGRDDFEDTYPKASTQGWDTEEGYVREWVTADDITIAQKWWKVPDQRHIYLVERDGERQVVNELKEGEEAIKERTVTVDKIQYCTMTSNEILIPTKDWPGRYYPFPSVWGKETFVKGKIRTRGMVRNAISPQQQLNYGVSSNTEYNSLAPKMPWLLTPKMLGAHKTMWEDFWRVNRPYLLFEPDIAVPGGMPKRESPPQASSAYLAQIAQHDHDIQAAMGLYNANLGDKSNEKSGKAVIAKQRQGDTGSYVFVDNMEYAQTYEVRALIDLIPHVYDTERIIRILGSDGKERQVPINARPSFVDSISDYDGPRSKRDEAISKYVNDLTVGKYDAWVTIGPSYQTQRQEAADSMMTFIQAVPSTAEKVIDLVAKNMDWPGADEFVERTKPASVTGADGQEMTPDMVQLVQREIERFIEGLAAKKAELEIQMQEAEIATEQAQADTEKAKAAKLRMEASAEDSANVQLIVDQVMDLLAAKGTGTD